MVDNGREQTTTLLDYIGRAVRLLGCLFYYKGNIVHSSLKIISHSLKKIRIWHLHWEELLQFPLYTEPSTVCM
jgi:hypothetical protein